MATIGLVLSHEQFPAPQLIDWGVAAERAGFDAIWTSDHFHPWMDNQGHSGQAWITLAALAQRMARIPFGTGVTCPTYRYHPAVVAHAFASLAVLYPGRVFLGVGSGEAVNERPASGEWGGYEERSERLVEAVELIRRLWTGQWVDHRGRYYRVEGARLYDPPPRPIPIHIAAGGAKSMRLAGAHGDGLISDSKQSLKPELRQAFERGAREAGKDPSRMPILAEHFVVVGGAREAEEAARVWRFSPKAFSAFVNDPDPRDIQRRAEREIPLEDVYKGWVVSDDPEAHARSIQELIDGGVTDVYIHSGQHDQGRVIDFYGREVLPRVRRQQPQTQMAWATP